MRNARRSKQQLTRTSANRARVFEFMERFGARHLYTMDSPIDTDLDEIMAFAYEGGVAVVHTFEGVNGLWTLYTEPSVSGDLDELEKAMRLQIIERVPGDDVPLSAMWAIKTLEGMIPRMSDEALKQASDLFDRALLDNKEATTIDDGSYTDDPRLAVRIPVKGMTPDGFEPYVVSGPIHFNKKAVSEIADNIGLDTMSDDNIRSFINAAEAILTTRQNVNAG